MSPSPVYIPSRLLTEEVYVARQQSFSRWMPHAFTQPASGFFRKTGLYPVYCEYSNEGHRRYLFWRLPKGAAIEVRSGRVKEKFMEFDRVNQGRDWRLLSLHVNENGIYSAVWVSSEHLGLAKAFLAAFGVVPAERREA
jgi:hypothetical protein